jgi:hypothetical protein
MKLGYHTAIGPRCGLSSIDISRVLETDRKYRSELLSPRIFLASNYSFIIY